MIMKILQFPAYVTINNDNDFNRSQSGYGYMTLDIAISMAQLGVEVDLLTQSNLTKGKKIKKVNILKRTLFDVIFNIKLIYIFWSLKVIVKDNISFKKMHKIFFYNISMGYFEKLIKSKNYDLVHIHGLGYYTYPIMKVCEKMKVKYFTTLHGLISFSDSINITSHEKKIEKEFLKHMSSIKLPVSVISNGVKQKILNFLEVKSLNNLYNIPNGSDISIKKSNNFNIRKKYNLSEGVKIFISVGNISLRKNQIQIISAYQKLQISDKEKIVFLFLGNDLTNGRFRKKIHENNLDDKLIICGNIDKKLMSAFYDQSDYNIVTSISEGFGLSMIEAFQFGLPTITFSDLDAIQDIYNEKAMLILKERSDKVLAEGISSMLKISWDKNSIKQHSSQFTLQEMAIKYLKVYKNPPE